MSSEYVSGDNNHCPEQKNREESASALFQQLGFVFAVVNQSCLPCILNRITSPHAWSLSGCRTSNTDMLHLLLRNGADAAATDARGNTAMHVAAFHGNLDSIEALIDAGASVAAKNHEGLVPVMLAPSPSPTLLALLARGASKNASRGLESFGLDAAVEARRVRLRLSSSVFTAVVPAGHGALAAVGQAPHVRFKAKEG